MKNILSYYYDINIDDIKFINDNKCFFYIDYQEFYFVKYNRPINDLFEIYNIISSYKNNYHIIVKNKFGYIYTSYNKENYILLKINSAPHAETTLIDVMKYSKSVQNAKVLDRTSWANLWSLKIDYIEYQVLERANEYKIINDTIDYYIGIAENAVSYFNTIDITNQKTYISSKRIFFPNINLNYYNPLNIVVDYKARNIAEYIKSAFFEGYDIKKEIISIISSNYLNSVDYNLIFVRLLYPSYYFDTIKRVIEEKESEESIIKYVDKAGDYEQFLNWFYYQVSKKYSLTKIDWLIKKEL